MRMCAGLRCVALEWPALPSRSAQCHRSVCIYHLLYSVITRLSIPSATVLSEVAASPVYEIPVETTLYILNENEGDLQLAFH